jgi:hypothetical protein
MVKILKIISVVIFTLAVVLLVYAVVFGARRDPKILEFIRQPGAAEKFAADKGRATPKESQASPLVKEATEISQYLNPPPPPPPVTSPVTAPTEPVPLGPVSAKFNLVGISYYPGKPGSSFALIDEPGQGLHWVREGNSVGHLVIDKVKDNSITLRDGSRTFEMSTTAKEPWRSLVKGASNDKSSNPAGSSIDSQRISISLSPNVASGGESAPTTQQQDSSPAAPISTRPGMRSRTTDNPAIRRPSRNAQSAATEQPSTTIPAPQQTIEPPQLPALTPAEQAATISDLKKTVKKQIDDAKSSRVSPEEAQQMNELAKALEQLEKIEKQNPEPNK